MAQHCGIVRTTWMHLDRVYRRDTRTTIHVVFVQRNKTSGATSEYNDGGRTITSLQHLGRAVLYFFIWIAIKFKRTNKRRPPDKLVPWDCRYSTSSDVSADKRWSIVCDVGSELAQYCLNVVFAGYNEGKYRLHVLKLHVGPLATTFVQHLNNIGQRLFNQPLSRNFTIV